ncbi:MAG: hybrid sensor histidine kinase/response regulator, partial [Pseudomonadaceae bacterium]|nr:hybrid sensor histidine kinase/response regulator [Pseudomonadaceae bacterium]
QSTQTQLQAKPACTRKLQRAMIELISPRQPISEQPTLAPSRAPLVLCVDDNPANLLLVKTLLSDMGANVATAGNGFDAIKLTKQNVYDLILMDVQMPGLDGRQTTEQIRQWEQDHQRQPLPIVALTAHAMSNEKRALLQCGMDDYLTKPVSERQLAQVVLKWTGLGLRQYATEPSPEPVVSIASARVLDNEEGLRLAAGKADLAADMLSMLIAGLPADKQAIRQARKDADRNELLERVHRLHGATRYCGVPQLRAACQRSETFLKQENPEVDSALDALEAAIETLAREVSAVQQ